MKRAIKEIRKVIVLPLFLTCCITNSVIEESKDSSYVGASSQYNYDATINIEVEIDTLYHKGFTFANNPTVEVESVASEVEKVGEYRFTLLAQATSSCVVIISDINIPLSGTYGATTRCAISSPTYLKGGEERDIVISLNHTNLDENGVALLPQPILFDASVEDWSESTSSVW